MNKTITFEIPDGAEPSQCRGCKSLIYWIKTTMGRNMPVDPDGTSHFATCPKADSFRHYDPKRDPRRTRQTRIFGLIMGNAHRLNDWEENFMNAVASKMSSGKQLTSPEDASLEKIYEDRGT